MEGSPLIHLLSGPNGSGKTTAAFSIMPELIDCHEFVNADAIAAALSPFKPQEVSMEAGRIMLKRIRELAEAKVDFAFETTLASRSFAPFLKQCKRQGYIVRLIYIWVSSAELAINRVKQRVASGGHSVPEEIVRRRYARSLTNFFDLYLPLADQWSLYDNSQDYPVLIAASNDDGSTQAVKQEIWDRIQGNITIEKYK